MNKIRGFTYIIPYMLLCGLIFSGCGGGESYTETAQPIVVSADCLACHGTAIADTHYDDAVTTPTHLEGYVLDNAVSWAPEGRGYVLRTGAGACSASCHNYHSGDMSINREWYKSGHADVSSAAFIYNFAARSTNGPCLRCHSGIGHASYVDPTNGTHPAWQTAPTITTEFKTHHITCNACHDALVYPTDGNKRLRKTGSVKLTSGSSATFVQDKTLDVGNSASCFLCHQGTESGWSLYKKMISKDSVEDSGDKIDPYDGSDETLYGSNTATNPHYMQAGAMLFSVKGYEFKYFDRPGPQILNPNGYSNGNTFHQGTNCTGCHMANSSDEDLGGHTFKVSYGAKKNIAICQGCHPGLADFETFHIYDRDMDGDGTSENIKDEIEGLKNNLINALASESPPIYYNPAKYPYFFNDLAYSSNKTTWKESQYEAAFNLMFVDKEPGAYFHNFKYAAQLLWDSHKALGVTPPGLRPSSSDDRPATTYN